MTFYDFPKPCMSLSSFSLVVGVFCYVFGFPLVFCDEKHLAWRKKFLRDENMMRMIGMAFTMVAAITLRRQWVISGDGEGLVVAVAWFVFAKSLFMAWWPAKYSKMRKRYEEYFFDTPAIQMFVGFLMVLTGALFTYLGILMPA